MPMSISISISIFPFLLYPSHTGSAEMGSTTYICQSASRSTKVYSLLFPRRGRQITAPALPCPAHTQRQRQRQQRERSSLLFSLFFQHHHSPPEPQHTTHNTQPLSHDRARRPLSSCDFWGRFSGSCLLRPPVLRDPSHPVLAY